MNSFIKVFLYFFLFVSLLFVAVFGARFAQKYLIRAREDVVPQNVLVSQITQTGAKITWQTKKETQSTVIYGEEEKNLPLMVFESKRTTDHEVNLSLLNPGTKYYFKIKVGDKEFDDEGIPWQFTTLSSVATPTPSAFDPNRFSEKFGTFDPLYDLNHDGIVNLNDYSLYLQSQ